MTATSNQNPATPSPQPGPDTTKSPMTLQKLQKSIVATEDCLRPFPIGWTEENRAKWTSWTRERPTGWLALIGCIVTGLALSLGAPFWFDLLGKFMNIRGAGPKPARTDSK
jgi:hypothetical protein